MQTVSQAEAMQKLPELLQEAKSSAVVIRDGNESVGAIVSMDDYEVVRRAKIDKALKAMDDLGALLRREAAREGTSLDELEKMLDRHTI